VWFQISVVDAGNRYLSHLRDVYLPGTVDGDAQVSFNLAPNLNL